MYSVIVNAQAFFLSYNNKKNDVALASLGFFFKVIQNRYRQRNKKPISNIQYIMQIKWKYSYFPNLMS